MIKMSEPEEDTKTLIQLICKLERVPTPHTIDGMMLQKEDLKDHPEMIKYATHVQYTCQSCYGTFYYPAGSEPVPDKERKI
jgi:hypothetical protein